MFRDGNVEIGGCIWTCRRCQYGDLRQQVLLSLLSSSSSSWASCTRVCPCSFSAIFASTT